MFLAWLELRGRFAASRSLCSFRLRRIFDPPAADLRPSCGGSSVLLRRIFGPPAADLRCGLCGELFLCSQTVEIPCRIF